MATRVSREGRGLSQRRRKPECHALALNMEEGARARGPGDGEEAFCSGATGRHVAL